jgi:hypothetical protein
MLMNTDIQSELNDVLTSLEAAREEFEAFQAVHPHIVNERLAWVREGNKSLDSYNEADQSEHRSREPGLASLLEVAAARSRVEAAKIELHAAQANLVEVESNGTPLGRYLQALGMAESSVTGLAASAARERKAELLESTFGTRDDWRLSREATDAIKFKPEVAKLESFRYRGVIAGQGEAVSSAQLTVAYDGVVDAAIRLRDLLAE